MTMAAETAAWVSGEGVNRVIESINASTNQFINATSTADVIFSNRYGRCHDSP